MSDNSEDKSELTALIALITQSRVEDKEAMSEMRQDMRDLTKSVNTLTNAMTESVSSRRHTEKEIEDIKADLHGKGGITERVGALEIKQAEDARNWLFVTTVAVIVFTGIVGYYFTIVKPIQQANVSNDKVIQLIESIDRKIESTAP